MPVLNLSHLDHLGATQDLVVVRFPLLLVARRDGMRIAGVCADIEAVRGLADLVRSDEPRVVSRPAARERDYPPPQAIQFNVALSQVSCIPGLFSLQRDEGAVGALAAWHQLEYPRLVRATSLTRALEAMASMAKGSPYSLRPDDAKRRLVDDLARLCSEANVKPVVIGGLAVNHHGYMRFTADVDILVARAEVVGLYRRLRSEPGWKKYAEGFKNTVLGVGLDVCVEGERTAPRSREELPDPAELAVIDVGPLPVPELSELLALKVMSGRARDDADVVELLKRHASRTTTLNKAASRRLRTSEARARLAALVTRAKAEAARRR